MNQAGIGKSWLSGLADLAARRPDDRQDAWIGHKAFGDNLTLIRAHHIVALDQLDIDPQTFARLLNAALDNVAYTKLPTDIGQVDGLSLQREGGTGGDDKDGPDARQRRDHPRARPPQGDHPVGN